METNVKQLTITGQAAEEMMKPRRSSGGGGSRRKRVPQKAEEEPFDLPDDELTAQLKRINVKKETGPMPQGGSITKVNHSAPPVAAITPAAASVQAPSSQPTQPIQPPEINKVILKPPRQVRVKLQPKGINGHSQKTGGGVPMPSTQTRKARRIKLSVANLTQRFTRAKRVKDTTEKEPLTNIREFLVKRGVIQEKSKAPERMLRAMYSDFMLLKDQAL